MAAITRNHGFTTRQLGLQGHERDCHARWAGLASDEGVLPDALVRLAQVHSAAVSVVETTARPDEVRRADAVITARPDVLLTVRVADCVPLLLADAASGAVAAVHAGWRGAAASIAVRAVERLTARFHVESRSLVAAVGPSIGPCCYTVGSELVDAFRAAGHTAEDCGRWFRRSGTLTLDLWNATRDQLTASGLRPEAVHVAGLCTACHPDVFYSYRREGPRAGRLVGFIRAPLRP